MNRPVLPAPASASTSSHQSSNLSPFARAEGSGGSGAGSTEGGGGAGGSGAGNRRGKGPRPRPRVYTSKACRNCQVKKIKCSGQPAPCARCLAEQVECLFDFDGRRRETSALQRQRQLEENSRLRQTLQRLIEHLRAEDNDDQLERIRRSIRQDPSIVSVSRLMEDLASSAASATEEVSNPVSSETPLQQSTTSHPDDLMTQLSTVDQNFEEWIGEVFDAAGDMGLGLDLDLDLDLDVDLGESQPPSDPEAGPSSGQQPRYTGR